MWGGNEGIKGSIDFMLRRLQFQFMLNLTASEEETSAEQISSTRTQNTEGKNCTCAQNIPNPPYVHSSTCKSCHTCAYIPQGRKEMFYSSLFHHTPVLMYCHTVKKKEKENHHHLRFPPLRWTSRWVFIRRENVTAPLAFPFLTPHLAFLSLYLALLQPTQGCKDVVNCKKKRRRIVFTWQAGLHLLWQRSLTIGLYSASFFRRPPLDAPTEGLYVLVALKPQTFVCCEDGD